MPWLSGSEHPALVGKCSPGRYKQSGSVHSVLVGTFSLGRYIQSGTRVGTCSPGWYMLPGSCTGEDGVALFFPPNIYLGTPLVDPVYNMHKCTIQYNILLPATWVVVHGTAYIYIYLLYSTLKRSQKNTSPFLLFKKTIFIYLVLIFRTKFQYTWYLLNITYFKFLFLLFLY